MLGPPGGGGHPEVVEASWGEMEATVLGEVVEASWEEVEATVLGRLLKPPGGGGHGPGEGCPVTPRSSASPPTIVSEAYPCYPDTYSYIYPYPDDKHTYLHDSWRKLGHTHTHTRV